jgi:hypothetical protein
MVSKHFMFPLCEVISMFAKVVVGKKRKITNVKTLTNPPNQEMMPVPNSLVKRRAT